MKAIIILLFCSMTVFAQSQDSPANYKRPAKQNKAKKNVEVAVVGRNYRPNLSLIKYYRVSRNYKIPVSQKPYFDMTFSPVIVSNEKAGINYRSSERNYKAVRFNKITQTLINSETDSIGN